MTKSTPSISVIIPAFNQAEYLASAIQSVLGQSVPADEVIVVNDGSTDHTPEVLATFGDRIDVISQENRGLSSARNAGLERATGDLVAFLDADDWWMPEMLHWTAPGVDPESNRIATCCGVKTDFQSRPLRIDRNRSEWSRALLESDPVKRFAVGNATWVHTVVAPRRLIQGAGGFDEGLAAMEDYDLWLRLAKGGSTYRTVPYLGAIYRQHASSMNRDVDRMNKSHQSFLNRSFIPALGDPADPLHRVAHVGMLFGYIQMARRWVKAGESDGATNCLERATEHLVPQCRETEFRQTLQLQLPKFSSPLVDKIRRYLTDPNDVARDAAIHLGRTRSLSAAERAWGFARFVREQPRMVVPFARDRVKGKPID